MLRSRKPYAAALCAAAALVTLFAVTFGGSANAASAPIKIMVSYPKQAPAYAAPEILDNVKAAVTAANKDGGINGAKIQLLSCDNGHDPNKAAQCAQSAVEKKVVAMVGNYTFLAAQGFYPTLEKAKIPTIGNGGSGPSEWTSPMSFPVSYSAQAYVAGPPIAMARAGCKKIVPVGYDDPAYDPYFGFATAGIKKAGVTNLGAVRFPATTTDMTATVQSAINKGADCIFTLGPNQTVPPIVRAIKNSGKKIKVGGLTHVYDNLAGLGRQLDGAALVEPTPRPTFSPPKNANKYLKQYIKEMKAIGATKNALISDNGVSAWIGAKFFIELARSLPKGKVTSAALVAAGNKAKFSMPGFVGASDFTKAGACSKVAPRLHNYLMYTKKIVNGKIVETGSTDLANLFKGLGC